MSAKKILQSSIEAPKAALLALALSKAAHGGRVPHGVRVDDEDSFGFVRRAIEAYQMAVLETDEVFASWKKFAADVPYPRWEIDLIESPVNRSDLLRVLRLLVMWEALRKNPNDLSAARKWLGTLDITERCCILVMSSFFDASPDDLRDMFVSALQERIRSTGEETATR